MPARAERSAPFWLLRRTPADLPWYLLAFQTVVAVVVSPLPARSLVAVIPHAVGLLAYWVMSRWNWTPVRLQRSGLAAAALTIALSLGGLLGLWSSALSPFVPARVADLLAGLRAAFNPNVLAGYLALLVPLNLGLLAAPARRDAERPASRLTSGAAAAGLLFGAVALAATGSRAGLVAGAVGAIAVAAWRWPRPTLGLAVLGAVAFAWGAPHIDWPALGQALTAGSGGASGLPERTEIWQRAVYIVQDFAFTGLGFGCFEPVVEVMYPLFLSASGTQPHAHNLLLQVAVDLGMPGLVAYIAFQALTFGMLIRAVRRGSLLRGLAVGLAAGLLSVQVHGILDATVWGNAAAMIPWALAALAVPLYEARDVAQPEGRPDA